MSDTYQPPSPPWTNEDWKRAHKLMEPMTGYSCVSVSYAAHGITLGRQLATDACKAEIADVKRERDTAEKRVWSLRDALRTNERVLSHASEQLDKARDEAAALKGQLDTVTQQLKALITERDAPRGFASLRPPCRRLHPWKPEEVPVGAQIRLRERQGHCRWTLTMANDSVAYCGAIVFGFEALAERYEYSTDHGLTWSPAGRVEEVAA